MTITPLPQPRCVTQPELMNTAQRANAHTGTSHSLALPNIANGTPTPYLTHACSHLKRLSLPHVLGWNVAHCELMGTLGMECVTFEMFAKRTWELLGVHVPMSFAWAGD